eukprot:8634163-Pyramimonas_sp.AAC.1
MFNHAVLAHADVVRAYLAYRWNSLVPQTLVDEAFQWAVDNVDTATCWDCLHGPVSSTVATLLRL